MGSKARPRRRVFVTVRPESPSPWWPTNRQKKPAYVYIQKNGISWSKTPIPLKKYLHSRKDVDHIKRFFVEEYGPDEENPIKDPGFGPLKFRVVQA